MAKHLMSEHRFNSRPIQRQRSGKTKNLAGGTSGVGAVANSFDVSYEGGAGGLSM